MPRAPRPLRVAALRTHERTRAGARRRRPPGRRWSPGLRGGTAVDRRAMAVRRRPATVSSAAPPCHRQPSRAGRRWPGPPRWPSRGSVRQVRSPMTPARDWDASSAGSPAEAPSPSCCHPRVKIPARPAYPLRRPAHTVHCPYRVQRPSVRDPAAWPEQLLRGRAPRLRSRAAAKASRCGAIRRRWASPSA